MTRSLLVLAMIGMTTSSLYGGTILKFDLGTAGQDFQLQGGALSTVNDGNAATLGDQDTNVNFTGFVSGLTDIPGNDASFSLSGVQVDGPASIIGGGLAVQPTTGGVFHLFDDGNILLLSGSVVSGSINGAVGGAATGSFFNIDSATVTGGLLAPQLDPDSLAIAISFTDVNDGNGFSVDGTTLESFVAAGTGNIAASVPEPSSILLAFAGLAGFGLMRRRRSL